MSRFSHARRKKVINIYFEDEYKIIFFSKGKRAIENNGSVATDEYIFETRN